MLDGLKNKKVQWAIAWYLSFGMIYALWGIIRVFFVKYAYFHTGLIGLKLFLTDMLFYPFILSLKFFDVNLRYTMYWWFLGILIIVYILHLGLEKLKTPFWIEVKHIIVGLVTMFIFLSLSAQIISFDNEQVLKSNNYRTMLIDYNDRIVSQNNYSSFDGMTFYNDELKLFFVNDEFINDVGDYSDNDNITTLGLITHSDDSIYINFEGIDSKTNSTDEYYDKVENTFLHEITHYLDREGKLGNKMETLGFVTEDSRFTINQQKWIDLYENNSSDVPEHLRKTIDFNKVFNELDYDYTDWKDEIVARTFALCLELDESNNYNEVKVANYTMCKQFNFTETQMSYYDDIVQDFVISYVDSFYLDNKQRIVLEKGN